MGFNDNGINKNASRNANDKDSTAAQDAIVSAVARRRQDVRMARDRLGVQFEELKSVLPRSDADGDLTAKSRILEHSCVVLRKLMTTATNYAVSLAVAAPEATYRWVLDISENGTRSIDLTIADAMKLFCFSRRWQYAELWSLGEASAPPAEGDYGIDAVKRIGKASLTVPSPDNVHGCVIRDFVSAMKLAKTLMNMKSCTKDVPAFARMSRDFQFRPRIGMPGRVWSSRRAEWLPTLGDGDIYRRSALAHKFGIKSCFAVPIVLDGQVNSVMAFYAQAPTPFNSKCYDLATTLSESIANIYRPHSSTSWNDYFQRMR